MKYWWNGRYFFIMKEKVRIDQYFLRTSQWIVKFVWYVRVIILSWMFIEAGAWFCKDWKISNNQLSVLLPWWFLNALFLTYNVLFITCYFSIRNVIRWDTFLVLLKRDHFICIQLLKRAFSFKIICCYFNIIRDMKPSWMKCGWNDRSCSFPMISVIPLDPLAGGKVFFLKNDALKRADQCWLLLLQK